MPSIRERLGASSFTNTLRGRDSEWKQIVGLLDRAIAGQPVMLLLEGQPGSGKTRLLQQLAAAATAARFTVLRYEHPLAWPPALAPGAATVPRQRPYPVLTREPAVGTGWAEGQFPPEDPVLLILDNAQWAAPGQLAMLSTGQRPRFCAVAYRTSGGHGPLGPLLHTADDSVLRITLGPLPQQTVAQLVADLLDNQPGPDVLTLANQAGGNPLLVTELVRGLREEGRLELGSDEVGLRSVEIPHRLRAAVQHQLDELSPRGRQLLQVASALGLSFALNDVAELLRETTASLLPALEEVLAAGVLHCDSHRLSFGSPLRWQIVKESLPVSVRSELDREAGMLLVSRGDEGAAPRSALAPAREPGQGSWSQLVSVVDRQFAAGHLGSAASLAEDALARPLPPAFAAELRSRLAHILVMAGRADRAMATVDPPLLGAEVSEQTRQNAEAARILALHLTGAPVAELATKMLADRERPGDPARVTAATVLANLHWNDGDLTGGLRLAREAVALIGSTTPSSWRTNARLALARKLANCREFEEAEELIRQAEADASQHGLTLHAAAPTVARARLLAQAGRPAQTQATAALLATRELGAGLLSPLAAAVAAFVALRGGDLLGAAEQVRRYRGELDSGLYPSQSVLYDWVELLLAGEQDGPRAVIGLLDAYPHVPIWSALFAEEPGAAGWLVRTALRAGDRRTAHTVAAAAEQLAVDNQEFSTVALAAVHARGLLERDVDALARASTQQPDPWARALAAEDLGQHREESGARRAATVEAYDRALRVFDGIGANRDSARVRARLRAFGVRRRAAVLPRGATGGWQSLSDSERTITHLVNQGLTNRQIAKRVFLSPHTVNYHLRQIFRKLEVGSRVELARLAQQQHFAAGEAPAGSVPAGAGSPHGGAARDQPADGAAEPAT